MDPLQPKMWQIGLIPAHHLPARCIFPFNLFLPLPSASCKAQARRKEWSAERDPRPAPTPQGLGGAVGRARSFAMMEFYSLVSSLNAVHSWFCEDFVQNWTSLGVIWQAKTDDTVKGYRWTVIRSPSHPQEESLLWKENRSAVSGKLKIKGTFISQMELGALLNQVCCAFSIHGVKHKRSNMDFFFFFYKGFIFLFFHLFFFFLISVACRFYQTTWEVIWEGHCRIKTLFWQQTQMK